MGMRKSPRVCVCVCVYAHAYMRTYVHVRVCVCVHVCLCSVCVRLCLCMSPGVYELHLSVLMGFNYYGAHCCACVCVQVVNLWTVLQPYGECPEDPG